MHFQVIHVNERCPIFNESTFSSSNHRGAASPPPPPPMLCVCECILENNVVLLTNFNLISHFNPLFLKRIRSFGCGTHTRSMGVGNAEVSWKSCNRKQDQNQFSLVFKSADVLFQGSSPCVCPLVTHLALNDTFKR